MTTVISGDFEWDDAKAQANISKHGVLFEEAITAFEDAHHLIVDDGSDRDQFLLIRFSIGGRLLTVVHVVHVERGQRDRIISAWRAARYEQDLYQHYREPT